jgi:hypothetical protein
VSTWAFSKPSKLIIMSNYIVDFQSKQLTLLDSRFYTTEEGSWVPSVTTILEAFPKDYGYFKWLKEVGEDADALRDEAGRRGSTVHMLTEKYDAGEEVTLLTEDGRPGYKMGEWSMFERYVEFVSKFPHDAVMIEQNIVSTTLGFAGTLDRVINMGGKLILLDIKTSNAIYPSYWLQLAAYRELLSAELEQEVDEVAILWLNAKTRTEGKKGAIQGIGWQLVSKADTTEDWELFCHTKKLWEAQNKDATPRQLSYQLSHKK